MIYVGAGLSVSFPLFCIFHGVVGTLQCNGISICSELRNPGLSLGGNFVKPIPQEHMTKFEEIFECYNWREGATGLGWSDSRDDAEVPIKHRKPPMKTPPHNKALSSPKFQKG